jgi:WD40 repeat protein
VALFHSSLITHHSSEIVMADLSSPITHHSPLPFYVIGGTLQLDAPCYVTRRADTDLYEGLALGKFCYALTPRQMGKSSLMIRAGARLREEGVGVAVLDLTAIGQNLDAEQWYGGLLNQIGQQLNLEEELLEFWEEHPQIGPLQRWMQAIREVVLARSQSRLVIFIDEIDAVRNLPFSTDEFFAGIRECYNRRAEDAELKRLAFCLLGVATPPDLIRDTRTTPFNIGQRIELTDFTEAEAAPLAQGLKCEDKIANALLKRILYWTGGHPYLTQRLCLAVAQINPQSAIRNPQSVDRLCDELFLSTRARELDDNLLFVRERILRSEADLAGLLDLYSRVRSQKRVRDDDTNPLVGILRLSGITRAREGYLYVRNRIYERVFDPVWISANMPDAELRRQRAAYRRGLIRATAAAAVILMVMGVLSVAAIRGWQQAVEQKRIAEQERAKAVQERSRAEEEARRADLSAEKLLVALEETKNQREIAEERGAEAEQQGLSNRRLLYAAQMNLAQKAWETNNTARVLDLLEGQQDDLRGFEWYYLWRLCHSDLLTLRLPVNVSSVAVSSDGKTVAAAGIDKIVGLWDVNKRRERVLLKVRPDEIKAIAFSADGKRVATGSEDGAVRLWDAATGKEMIFKQHTDPVTALAFSPDGRQLAIGSRDGATVLWEAATGKDSLLPVGHTHSVTSVAFSPDGRFLTTGSEDNTAKLWDVAAKKELHSLRGHVDVVTAVAFSPDGRQFATGSRDGTARIWNVGRGQEQFTLKGQTGAVTAVAFSPDGRRLAIGSSDNTIELWDTTVGQSLSTIKGHTGPIASVTFSQDGRRLITGSSDRTVKMWDLDSTPKSLSGEHDGQINSVAFSPDGRWLATASSDHTVRVWKAATGEAQNPFGGEEHADWVTSVAFSRDGKWLATGSNDGTVKLWDLATRQLRATIEQVSQVNSLAFSPNYRLLAIGNGDGTIKLWDVSGNREYATLEGNDASVTCVMFSIDGRRLAAGGTDGIARLWEIAMKKEIARLKSHKDAITSIGFSQDSKLLVTGSMDGTAILWDLATKRQSTTFGEGTRPITAAVFSPDSRRVATGSVDGTVKLWDVATRQEVYAFKEHIGRITAVAFSPDGKSLATGSWDRTWKLFRASTGKDLLVHNR